MRKLLPSNSKLGAALFCSQSGFLFAFFCQGHHRRWLIRGQSYFDFIVQNPLSPLSCPQAIRLRVRLLSRAHDHVHAKPFPHPPPSTFPALATQKGWSFSLGPAYFTIRELLAPWYLPQTSSHSPYGPFRSIGAIESCSSFHQVCWVRSGSHPSQVTLVSKNSWESLCSRAFGCLSLRHCLLPSRHQ